MSTPSISIVIPCYNCAPYLQRCLDSILEAQPKDLNLELICVDDASTDPTLSILQTYAQRYPIQIIALAQNAGPAAARNAGSSAASGRYLWFFDSDDFLLPQAWPRLLALMQRYPDQDMYAFGYETTQGQARKIVSKPPFRLRGASGKISGTSAITVEVFASMRFFPPMRILRRDIWLRHPFPTGQWFEDITSVASAATECQTCAWLAAPLWHYFMRPDSTTGSMSAKACHDLFYCLRDFRQQFLNSDLKEDRQLRFHFASFLLKLCLDAVCTLLTKESMDPQTQTQALTLLSELPNMLIEPMAQTQRRRLMRLRYKNWRTDEALVGYLTRHPRPTQKENVHELYLLACQRQKIKHIQINR